MKLYILVSHKYPVGYQFAQGMHVMHQWSRENLNHPWDNDTVVGLSCPDIEEWAKRLDESNICYSRFHEPDLDNELTALAVAGHDRLFKNLKLIGS